MPELVHRCVGNEGRVARFGHPLVTQLRVVDVREPVDKGLQPETVGILAVPVLDLAAQQRPDGRLQHRPDFSKLVSARQCHLSAPIVLGAGPLPLHVAPGRMPSPESNEMNGRYPSRSPSSRALVTAWLRVEAPSLR